MKLSKTERRKAVHSLIFGPPKSGKSKLAGELAEHGFNLFYFDFENGSLVLDTTLSPEAKERVELYRIPDTKDLPIGIETALRVVKPGCHFICDTHGKIGAGAIGTKCPVCGKIPSATYSTFDNTKLGPNDVVIFDSLTQLSNSAMSHIGQGKDDTWKPEWDHFRSQGSMLDRFLSSIQNAPYHVVCITHEMDIEMNDGPSKLVPIAGSQNFSRNSAKYFDEIVYCRVFNKRHTAASSTVYANNILTGSRSNTTVESIKDQEFLSLVPIFVNQGITGITNAEQVLLAMKESIKLIEAKKP